MKLGVGGSFRLIYEQATAYIRSDLIHDKLLTASLAMTTFILVSLILLSQKD